MNQQESFKTRTIGGEEFYRKSDARTLIESVTGAASETAFTNLINRLVGTNYEIRKQQIAGVRGAWFRKSDIDKYVEDTPTTEMLQKK